MAKYEWTYGEVKLVRVIDGDTAVFRLTREYVQNIDFGFGIKDKLTLFKETEIHFRIDGINTPELVGESRAKALEAKSELERFLNLGEIRLVSLKPDKYGGRYIAQLWVRVPGAAEVSVSQHMLDGGWAKPYDGTGAKPE